MTELKPCPFCGGKAEFAYLKGSGMQAVRCQKCRARTWSCYDTEDEAAAAWNNRHNQTCHVEYPSDARMCSECHYHIGVNDLFCPHCGAEVVNE